MFFCVNVGTILTVIFLGVFWTYAQELTFSWLPNLESNLGGYKIYYGFASKDYSFVMDIGNPFPISGRIQATIEIMQEGLIYFAATAYDIENRESDYSKEIPYEIGQGTFFLSIPQGFQFAD